MPTDTNPAGWNWSQAKAAGRNAASFLAGLVAMAAAWGLVSASQSAELTTNLTLIFSSLDDLFKGLAGVAAVVVPIYTAWRAANAASPSSQVKEVIVNLSASQITQAANSVADPTSRAKLIDAVAEMPEVKKIVPIDSTMAENSPSTKVVTQ